MKGLFICFFLFWFASSASLPTVEFCIVYQDSKVCVEFDPKTQQIRLSGDINSFSELSKEIIEQVKKTIKEQFGIDLGKE